MPSLRDAWWHNIQELRQKTDAIYQRREVDIWAITTDKIIEARHWVCNRERLYQVVQEAGVFYVPKTLPPGPLICFPEVDACGEIHRAQNKPLGDFFGSDRYQTFGIKAELFVGPVWLGNTDQTLQQILDLHEVVVVEGPFDYLAAHYAAPEVPVLCSLTKSLGDKHFAYLKILGVKRVHLLYDNDPPGLKAMAWLNKQSHSRTGQDVMIPCETLICPAEDPSDCLQDRSDISRLTKLLKSVVDE